MFKKFSTCFGICNDSDSICRLCQAATGRAGCRAGSCRSPAEPQKPALSFGMITDVGGLVTSHSTTQHGMEYRKPVKSLELNWLFYSLQSRRTMRPT